MYFHFLIKHSYVLTDYIFLILGSFMLTHNWKFDELSKKEQVMNDVVYLDMYVAEYYILKLVL